MAAPEGYKTLGKIGISYKGDYNPNTVYERLDAVYHNGSTYLAIKDAPDGAPRNDKINWIYLAKGYDGETVDVADSEIAFTDSETRENISTGEKVSTVFGKIKKFFADLAAPAFAQMITTKEDLLATKVTGYVPDAKAVADTYTELNRKLSVRYNTDTDTVQILYNGTWVDWKSGEQTDIPLFISGQGSVNTDISGGFTKTIGNYTGNVNLNAIVMSTTNATNTSGSYSVVIGSGKLIDHTVYKKVKFHATVSGSGSNNAYANLNTAKTNYGERLAPKDGYHRIVTGDNVLDISDAASNGYLCFFLGVNSGTVSVTIDSIVLCK